MNIRHNILIRSLMNPGISAKLTLFFILFGVIIGYLTTLYFVMGSTQIFIDSTRRLMSEKFKTISQGRAPDILASPAVNLDKELNYGLRMLKELAYDPDIKANMIIYYLDRSVDRWVHLDIGDNGLISSVDADKEISALLDRSLRNHFRFSARIYFGRKDTVNLFIDITGSRDRNLYVLALTASRDSIMNMITREKGQTIVYTLLLLFISTLLGISFGKRIAGPVEHITEEAEKMAAGDLERTFTVKRSDEIGRLGSSLNAMSYGIRKRIAAMETMNLIDKAILSSISRYDLLNSVIKIVSGIFEDTTAAMVLRDENRSGFEILTARAGVYSSALSKKTFVEEASIPAFVLGKRSVAYQCGRSSTGEDREAYIFFSSIEGEEPGVVASIPIYISAIYRGSLFILRRADRFFADDELLTLKMLADQAGVALHSLNAFEEKESLLLGIMIALTRSIDAKSKWTAGHSERVARFSELIAKRLFLTEQELRVISYAAILHDIGKIGVPENILDKPGRLTEEEYAVIKTHPESGAHIIRDISRYTDIMPGILHHHEHWDGSGYPAALRGESIPLPARIIVISDIYDAITADRPYRKGMNKHEAVAFMNENSGRLFDPEILKVFLDILQE